MKVWLKVNVKVSKKPPRQLLGIYPTASRPLGLQIQRRNKGFRRVQDWTRGEISVSKGTGTLMGTNARLGMETRPGSSTGMGMSTGTLSPSQRRKIPGHPHNLLMHCKERKARRAPLLPTRSK